MKLHIWTDRVSYLAVAHADNVAEARKLLLKTTDLGESGDGSCPERDRARETVREETPAIYYGEIAEFSLSDSAELQEQEKYSEKLHQQISAKDRRIAELEAEVSDFDCEMTIIAQAITAAFEDGRLSPADKANLQLADIAESKKWTTEETDKMRERIAELEAQVSGHPEAIAAAKREALEEASDWFAGQADDPASRDYWMPDDLACELRRMAREVKP